MPSNQLAIKSFVPDNAGFTHPLESQFTHFQTKGNHRYFGLSCEHLNSIMDTFAQEFIQKSREVFRDHLQREEFKLILNSLERTQHNINSLLTSFKTNHLYMHPEAVSKQVIKTGHIPVMLTHIATASSYEKAARSISSVDVQEFFHRFQNAQAQGREYCVKVDMMTSIAKLRNDIITYRYTLDIKDSLVVLCNQLIAELDTKIINVNQNAMPKEYEQFDLYHTFASKIAELTCQLDSKANQQTLNVINKIVTVLRTDQSRSLTVNAQERISTEMYNILIEYVNRDIGLGNAVAGEVNLTVEQDEMLQRILPLVAYLNSPANPFARNGLFGDLISNPFHNEAIKAYTAHESKEKTVSPTIQYHFVEPANRLEFTGEQIDQLLDGKKAAPQSQAGSVLASISGFLRIGNGASNGASQSAERRNLLALPAPREYTMLQLTDGRENEQQNAPSPNRP